MEWTRGVSGLNIFVPSWYLPEGAILRAAAIQLGGASTGTATVSAGWLPQGGPPPTTAADFVNAIIRAARGPGTALETLSMFVPSSTVAPQTYWMYFNERVGPFTQFAMHFEGSTTLRGWVTLDVVDRDGKPWVRSR